ncbi:restriction endonuclease subunit S [Methylovirgula sp. HY1]|uniref:restriction endonuclease subunit S n=1 Tax=Methylovirgula sp. HY1 TaxID=2822761 RepID=UPI001C5BA039
MPKSLADDQAISFLSMAGISENGQIDFEERRSAREVKKGYTYFERGDVLLAKITPCFENGKATRTGSLKNEVGFGSTEFHVFRASEDALPDYIFHAVWNPAFRSAGSMNMTGSAGQKRVPVDFLKRFEIPLPPLDEQRRIAAILDKADALRRKRKRALDLLDSLTQSIFLEMFGDPVSPNHHRIEVLGNVLLNIDSGWSPICLDRATASDEAGVLKLSALSRSGFLSAENKALPSDLDPKAGTEVASGDILFCRKNTRELVGASVYVWETRPGLHMSDLIFRLVPNVNCVHPIFLQAQLSMSSQRRRISDLAGGAAGSMPNVSKGKLRELKITLPDLSRQLAFAETMRKQRKLTAIATRSSIAGEHLFSSLQSRAFSGQL